MINFFKNFTKNKDGMAIKSEMPFYFMTAFPKSGSSFMFLTLARLLEAKPVDLVYSHFSEQDLYLPNIERYTEVRTITKHHTLATSPNLDLIKTYNMRPIVLTRNLPDVIVSLREHVIRTKRWPHFHLPLDFVDRTFNDQINFLIDFAVPWYLFFYNSWKTVEENDQMDLLFVDYAEIHSDKLQLFQKLTEYWNIPVSQDKIMQAILGVE